MKRRSFCIYAVIVAAFLLTGLISTLFIRHMYMLFHRTEVDKDAKSLSNFARSRITSYESYGWLIDHWTKNEDISPPADDMKYTWINQLDLPLVTEDDVRAMSKEEQEAFSYICYTRIAYGFDLLYDSFDTEELYCVCLEGDRARLLFRADSVDENNYHIPDEYISLDTDDHKALAELIVNDDNDGLMDKYYSSEKQKTYLVYYVPIRRGSDEVCFIIWERDWSDIQKEIDVGAVGVSAANIILLLIVDLIVLTIYRRYRKEKELNTAQLEKDKAEIEVCTKIQLSQMPDIQREVSGRKEFDFSSFIEPAKGVGGDFYDCFMIDDTHIGLVIADVSDKGIAAAMFMMAARSLIRSEMKQKEEPAEVMKKVNAQLSDRNEAEMFVTVWLAVVDLITGKCKVVNAGHENPLVRHSDGRCEILRYPHMIAAAITPYAEYKQREYILEPGDMVFVYTDGVTDALNSRKERFGENGILSVFDRYDCPDPESAVDSMCTELNRFSYGEEQFDDICMICFRYNGTDSISVNASDSELSSVIAFITAKAQGAGLSEKRISDLRLSAEEIFGNIIDYAYTDDTGTVLIESRTDREKATLEISFTDHGTPFDPTLRDKPDTPGSVSDIKIGGLGIFLAKEYTDNISYTYDNANILTITMNI